MQHYKRTRPWKWSTPTCGGTSWLLRAPGAAGSPGTRTVSTVGHGSHPAWSTVLWRCSGNTAWKLRRNWPSWTSIDSKYLCQLEASGWHAFVATVLKLASEVGEGVSMGQVAKLQEGEARTTSILVASAELSRRESFGLAPVWRG